MPGIVGLVTKMVREQAERQLLRMVAALRHETFYETGTFIDEPMGVYVGWVAPKGSSAGHMPVLNKRRDSVLVFSGEEYSESGAAGRFQEDSDFPAKLNGRFHGFVTDRKRRTSTLFTDRYAIHRMYYHEAPDAFYFAAEAKAILQVRPELRTLDPRGVGELVACGCVMENRTLFKDIHLLPPAAAWVFQDEGIQRRTYFEPREWEEQDRLEPEPYYRELREVFARSLPRYFSGEERIGMSLTGGLDTRMIMAWHKAPAGSLPCYSFGGMFRSSQDVRLARNVAAVCDQPHQIIPVGQEFLSRFAHYAERTVYLTDGCASVRHSPDLYVNERARTIAPVRMTGNYGGEVLRQVRAFKPVAPADGLFYQDLLPQIHAATGTYDRLVQGHPLSFALFRQTPWHHFGLLALEQTQLSVRSPYLDNDLVRTVFRAPGPVLADNGVFLRLIADGNPALRRIRTDRGLAGERGPMAAAIGRGLLELTFKAEYAYDYGMPQSLARIDHLLSPLHLERLFLGRHKFSHFRVWYREGLAPYVREMLLDPQTLSRPYLQPANLETMVRSHLQGRANFTSEIHTVLTLELLQRSLLDSPSVGVH